MYLARYAWILLSLMVCAQVVCAAQRIQVGTASYYKHGSKTANGELFNPNGLTAAHRSLAFGTKVRVTNTRTRKSVVVRINDRGPFVPGRIIDLAFGAAKVVGLQQYGVAKVQLVVLP